MSRCQSSEDQPFIALGATPREQSIRRHVRRMARWYRHLTIYLAVIAGLWLINALQIWTGSGPARWHGGVYWWAIWPTIGWGIAVALGAISVFGRGRADDDWQERKVRELMDRPAP